MRSSTLSGGCLCRQVRYLVSAPARCVIHCHCSQCRLSHATLVGTSATLYKDQFSIEKGKDNITSFEYPAGNHRKFCRTCGSSLFYIADDLPEMLFYFPATLDDGAHPGHEKEAEHHIHLSSKASWEELETQLQKHDDGIDRATLMNESG